MYVPYTTPGVVDVVAGKLAHLMPSATELLAMRTWPLVPTSRATFSVPLEVNSCLASSIRLVMAPVDPPTAMTPLLSMETTKMTVPVGC